MIPKKGGGRIMTILLPPSKIMPRKKPVGVLSRGGLSPTIPSKLGF